MRIFLAVFGPTFCLPPSSPHPMLLGTREAAALLRYGGCSAHYAEALFPGLPPVFLGVEAVLLPAGRSRGPLPLGLHLFPAFGFKGCRSRRGARLRLLGLRRCPSLSGWFPGFLPRLLRPGGRSSTRVARFRQREGELERAALVWAYCTWMRGLRDVLRAEVLDGRFIPAPAGSAPPA